MLKNIITLVLAATAAVNGSFVARAEDTASTVAAVAALKGANVTANFRFSVPTKDTEGLKVAIKVKGLKPGVSYPYHIHVNPVPADGNCTATGGHLDPAKVMSADKPYSCDPKNPATTCELGDLAGRHGNITIGANGEFSANYTDSLLSFSGTNSILGHSVVIHAPDNTRLACANITASTKSSDARESSSGDEVSASARASGAAHVSSAGDASDSVHASIATNLDTKKSAASSTAMVSGVVALLAAVFAL
ncbi:Cu,Zn superoxide dismutase-like protein [Martensiomyces pterosporus]|nr:Cu,Zn superoxide dismutase-like protein [Martensiomyces pterosporus]